MFIEMQNNLNVKSQLEEIVEFDFKENQKKDSGGVVVEKNHNVISSQSGASSADFMYYRMQRAKERARVAEIENASKKVLNQFLY